MNTRRTFRIVIACLYVISLFGPWDGDESFFDLIADALRYGFNAFLMGCFFIALSVPAGSVLVIFQPKTVVLIAYRFMTVLVGALFAFVFVSMSFDAGQSSVPYPDWGFPLYCLTLLFSFPVEYFPARRRPSPRRTNPDVFE